MSERGCPLTTGQHRLIHNTGLLRAPLQSLSGGQWVFNVGYVCLRQVLLCVFVRIVVVPLLKVKCASSTNGVCACVCIRVCVCVCVCVCVFGSLGHVHKNVIKRLQLGGLQKQKLATFCSAIIGSIERKMFCISSSCESVHMSSCKLTSQGICMLFLLLALWIQIKEENVCLKVCLAKL